MEGKHLNQIAFSNSARLAGRTHYFRYKNFDFKLVQSASTKFADTLMCITHSRAEQYSSYLAAAQFFSALCWAKNSCVEFDIGLSWSSRVPPSLKDAQPTILTFPKITPGNETAHNNISVLPAINTNSQREALALYREANASNNVYLRFFFFWQVLTIGPSKTPLNARDQIERMMSHPQWRMRDPHHKVDSLPLRGQTLAEYLHDDCRNAIGHVKRGGKKEIDFDAPEHRYRISESAVVAKILAAAHIEWNLNLCDELYLYKTSGGGIPEYLPKGSRPGRMVHPPKRRLRTIAPQYGQLG